VFEVPCKALTARGRRKRHIQWGGRRPSSEGLTVSPSSQRAGRGPSKRKQKRGVGLLRIRRPGADAELPPEEGEVSSQDPINGREEVAGRTVVLPETTGTWPPNRGTRPAVERGKNTTVLRPVDVLLHSLLKENLSVMQELHRPRQWQRGEAGRPSDVMQHCRAKRQTYPVSPSQLRRPAQRLIRRPDGERGKEVDWLGTGRQRCRK